MSIPAPEQTGPDLFEIEQLAAELSKRQAAIAADTERIDTIKAILRDRLPVGTHAAGAYTVQVKKPAQLTDWKAVAEAYPFAEHPGLYAASLDSAKAKQHLAPVVLAQFAKAPGVPTVAVS